MLKFLKICGALVVAVMLSIVVSAQSDKKPEWTEVTDRLQLQIDECRRDTRDLSSVERRLTDLEAKYILLEEQLAQVIAGESSRALLNRTWGRPGYFGNPNNVK